MFPNPHECGLEVGVVGVLALLYGLCKHVLELFKYIHDRRRPRQMLPWPVVTYTRCLREYPPRLSLQGSVSRKAIRYSCSEGTLTFSERLSQGRKLDIPTSGHWDGGGRTQPHTESGRVNVASGHCTVQWTAEGGSNRFVPCNCYIHASTSRFLDNSAPST